MAKHCEVCGAKLSVLNTYLGDRKKCYPCGHKEFLRRKGEIKRHKRESAALAQQKTPQQPPTEQEASNPINTEEYEQSKPALDDGYFKNHCEGCGAKLGRLNTPVSEKDKTRKKCNDCVRGRKKSLPLIYQGGFAGTGSSRNVFMRFNPSHVAVESSPLFGKGEVLWTMPYNKIKKIHIDTTKNLTAMRLLLTGVLAFGLKKKHRYLMLSFEDEFGLEQTPVFDGTSMDSAQKTIYERIALNNHKAGRSEYSD